jgi:biopolymer transport protein TolR
MRLSELGPREEDSLDDHLLAEINITPFVDVMLVVLVIFMVAAPLMIHGLPIDLPKASAGTLGRTAKPLIVSLSRDGGLQIGNETIIGTGLAERLAALRHSEGDAAVYVRADRGVAYGAVADILGRLAATGFTRVSLLTAPVPTQTEMKK